MRSRRRRLRPGLAGAAATLVLALCPPTVAMAVEAPGPGSASPAVPLLSVPTPPTATPPDLAFTDDRDQIVAVAAPVPGFAASQLAPAVADGFDSPGFAQPSATHEGEVSVSRSGDVAFVSTRDSPAGDVYVQPADGGTPIRVTCDPATKTHPVVSRDGDQVAYATNAGGSFQIAVAAVSHCGGDGAQLLAGQSGDNMWPTWIDDGTLAYSSTRDNPLGDIYEQGVDGPSATRLTDGTADQVANTQPFLARPADGPDSPFVLLLTTTAVRPDGSVGEIIGPATGDTALPRPVRSPWDAAPPQGSEPAVLGGALAFTTTVTNPLGSVVEAFAASTPPAGTPLQFRTGGLQDEVNDSAAASHPAWEPDGTLLYTVRSMAADVAAVSAADGSGRGVLAHAEDAAANTLDSATPAYSPDGRQIAVSQQVAAPGHGRQLWIASADGSGSATAVQDGWQDSAAASSDGVTDFDIQPAWSPDGTQLAFVRAEYRYIGGVFTLIGRQIWIADLAGNTAHRVSPENGTAAFWGHPSWSPDGGRLVVSHSDVAADLRVGIIANPSTFDVNGTTTLTVTASDDASGAALDASVTVTAPSGLDLSPTADCPGSAASVTCSAGTLLPGAQQQFPITATATQPLDNATVTAQGTTSSLETDYANDTATTTVSTLAADLLVNLTHSFDSGTNNDTYAVSVHNNGPATSKSVTLTLDFTGDAVVSASAACTLVSAGHYTCDLGDLTAGATSPGVTFSTHEVNCGGTAGLTATATAATHDPDTSNNTATNSHTDPCIKFRQSAALPRLAPALAPVPTPSSGKVVDPVRELPGQPVVSPPELWVIDTSTSNASPLSSCSDDLCPIRGRAPAWSPTGNRIAYEDTSQIELLTLAPNSDVATSIDSVTGYSAFDTSGSETVRTPTPSRAAISAAHDAAWWPDGSAIVFAGQPAGQPDRSGIYKIAPDGSGLAAVVNDPEPETEPSVQPTTDVGIALTATPATIVLADTTTVTATVTNNGSIRAIATTVTVALPGGLSVSSVPAPCTLAAATITCSLGTLGPGATQTITFIATGTAVGTQTVTATVTTQTVDPNPANDTATTTVEVVPPEADLAVTLAAAPASITQGHHTTLTAVVGNAGPQAAKTPTLTITLPGGLSVGTLPASCSRAGATITCNLATLASGGSKTFTFTATGTAVGDQTVTAHVASTTDDPDLSNNSASVTVTVGGTDVAVTIALSASTGYVGGPMSATITVTNHGPGPASDVTLSTSHSPPLHFTTASAPCVLHSTTCSLGTLAVGAHVSFTAHFTPAPVGSPAHGYQATIKATVATTTTDIVPQNNTAIARLTIKQPTIELLPPIGPPGFVTLAYGQDMPPGSWVTLVWSKGITTDVGPFLVGADGTITVPVLVVRRDSELGERHITATSTMALFGPLTARMLVVPGRQSPPGFIERS